MGPASGPRGAELLAQRLSLVSVLEPLADKAYEQVAPGGGPVALEYRSAVAGGGREELAAQLLAALGRHGARRSSAA